MTEHGPSGPNPPEDLNSAEFNDPVHDFITATDRAANLHTQLVERLIGRDVMFRALDEVAFQKKLREGLTQDEFENLFRGQQTSSKDHAEARKYFDAAVTVEDSARARIEDIDGFRLRTAQTGKATLERQTEIDGTATRQTAMYAVGGGEVTIKKNEFKRGEALNNDPDFDPPSVQDVAAIIDQLSGTYATMLELDDESLRAQYIPESS